MKKFRFIDNTTNIETESDAFEVVDHTSTGGVPNAPIITNAMGYIDESLLTPVAAVYTGNELFVLEGVAASATVTVLEKTVTEDTILNAIEVSTNNHSIFNVYINNVLQARRRIYYLKFYGIIDFGRTIISASDILKVEAVNASEFVGNFEARLLYEVS